jgi:hypothetical protein
MVVPGMRRDELLDAPQQLNAKAPTVTTEWWRLVAVS